MAWSLLRGARPLMGWTLLAMITHIAMPAYAADATATTIVVVAPRTPADKAQLAMVVVRAIEELAVIVVTADPGVPAELAAARGAVAVLSARSDEGGDVVLAVWDAGTREGTERRIARAGERQSLDELTVAARFAVVALLDERTARPPVVAAAVPVAPSLQPRRFARGWLGVAYAGSDASAQQGWRSGVAGSIGFIPHRRVHIAVAGTYVSDVALAGRAAEGRLERLPVELAVGARASAGPFVLALEAAAIGERRVRATTDVDEDAGFAARPASTRWLWGAGVRGRVELPLGRYAQAFGRVGVDVIANGGRVYDDVDRSRLLDDPSGVRPLAELGAAVVFP